MHANYSRGFDRGVKIGSLLLPYSRIRQQFLISLSPYWLKTYGPSILPSTITWTNSILRAPFGYTYTYTYTHAYISISPFPPQVNPSNVQLGNFSIGTHSTYHDDDNLPLPRVPPHGSIRISQSCREQQGMVRNWRGVS